MNADELRKHADLMKNFVLKEAKKIRESVGICPTCDKEPCVCDTKECPKCHKKVCICESHVNLPTHDSKKDIDLPCGNCAKCPCICEDLGNAFEYPNGPVAEIVKHLEDLIENSLKIANRDRNLELHDAITHLVEALKILKHK